jgi:hypothetical protein
MPLTKELEKTMTYGCGVKHGYRSRRETKVQGGRGAGGGELFRYTGIDRDCRVPRGSCVARTSGSHVRGVQTLGSKSTHS